MTRHQKKGDRRAALEALENFVDVDGGTAAVAARPKADAVRMTGLLPADKRLLADRRLEVPAIALGLADDGGEAHAVELGGAVLVESTGLVEPGGVAIGVGDAKAKADVAVVITTGDEQCISDVDHGVDLPSAVCRVRSALGSVPKTPPPARALSTAKRGSHIEGVGVWVRSWDSIWFGVSLRWGEG